MIERLVEVHTSFSQTCTPITRASIVPCCAARHAEWKRCWASCRLGHTTPNSLVVLCRVGTQGFGIGSGWPWQDTAWLFWVLCRPSFSSFFLFFLLNFCLSVHLRTYEGTVKPTSELLNKIEHDFYSENHIDVFHRCTLF